MAATVQYQAVMPSPVGTLAIRFCGERLCAIGFSWEEAEVEPANSPLLQQVRTQLEDYFRDSHSPFRLPLETVGTPFQQQVWQRLQSIPVGQVVTYGELASELGSSPRAVGNACRRNPIPLVIPCHRVVSASGIGGFSGSRSTRQLDVKQWLLRHEGVVL